MRFIRFSHHPYPQRKTVLLDLRGLPFLEEAQRFCPDGQLSAASRKDPSPPPEFLKSQKNLLCSTQFEN
jgi:hypothetical protein